MTIKNRRTRNKSIRRTIKKGRRTSRKRGQSIRKVKATRKRSSTRKRASTRKRSSKRKRSSTRKRRSTRELRNVVLGGSGLGEWRTLIPQVTEEIAESDTMKCLERRENNVRTLMGDGFTIGDAMEGNHEYESAHIDYCNKNEHRPQCRILRVLKGFVNCCIHFNFCIVVPSGGKPAAACTFSTRSLKIAFRHQHMMAYLVWVFSF